MPLSTQHAPSIRQSSPAAWVGAIAVGFLLLVFLVRCIWQVSVGPFLVPDGK